jgi:hypothetical protein
MGVCLGIYFNVLTLPHTFGFDSLRSKWNALILLFQFSYRLRWRFLFFPLVFVRQAGNLAGKGAKTVVRLNPKEEQRRREKEEKAARKPAVVAKYSEWNAGVTTVKQKEQAAAEFLHEARKLLARYADDTDLEATLREGGHAEGAQAGQRLHVGVREEEEGQEVQGCEPWLCPSVFFLCSQTSQSKSSKNDFIS